MAHVVLLGDSIFDNARYVPGGPSVIEHLRRCLPSQWRATLLAVDGSVTEEVAGQLTRVPADATHLVVSSGGNDALGHSMEILNSAAASFTEVLTRLAEIHASFQDDYRFMLKAVVGTGKSIAVCTVYDAIPMLGPAERMGLGLFNDVIVREACRVGVPVLDLRLTCNESTDYAPSSPIEPSVAGGGKIARTVARVVLEHDYSERTCQIYN